MTVFIDSSAIVSMMMNETDADDLANRLELNAQAFTSPIVIHEVALAIVRKNNMTIEAALKDIRNFLTTAEISVLDITATTATLSLQAFDRFGKGRHRANLNMGDCFSYACAQQYRLSLLFKGDDFNHTDIRLA